MEGVGEDVWVGGEDEMGAVALVGVEVNHHQVVVGVVVLEGANGDGDVVEDAEPSPESGKAWCVPPARLQASPSCRARRAAARVPAVAAAADVEGVAPRQAQAQGSGGVVVAGADRVDVGGGVDAEEGGAIVRSGRGPITSIRGSPRGELGGGIGELAHGEESPVRAAAGAT